MKIQELLKQNKLALFAVLGVGLAGYMLMPAEEEPVGSLTFGDPSALSSLPLTSKPLPLTSEPLKNIERRTPSSNGVQPIELPDYMMIVELAKLVNNVQNAPEAILETQMLMSRDLLALKADVAEQASRESMAKLELMKTKKEITKITPDMVATNKRTPDSDLFVNDVKSVVSYNYAPTDFRVSGIYQNEQGKYIANIEYNGEILPTRSGTDLLPKIKTIEVKKDAVVLAIPTYGVISLPVRL